MIPLPIGRSTCRAAVAALLLPGALSANAPAAAPSGAEVEVLTGSVSNALRIMRDHGLPLDAQAAANRAVEAMVRTADPAARILTPAGLRHHNEERFGLDYSLGLRLGMSNGVPRVKAVQADGPAAAAGLRTNDVLLSVNGTNCTGVGLLAALDLLRGHDTQTVSLAVLRDGATNTLPASLSLLRQPPLELVEDLPSNLAYLKVNGMFREAGRETVSLLRGMAETGRSGVVLDLRAAGGDDLASVTAVASLFAEGGALLFTLRDMADQDLSVQKASEGGSIGIPVMVLVDGRTAGASEVLAAVLNDSVRGAMLIGRTTAGDPLVREAIELPTGDHLYVATRRLVMANGRVHAGREGVAPDVVVEAGAPAAPEYEPDLVADRRVLLEKEIADKALRERVRGDPALRRAVDILLGLKALNIGPHGLSSGAR
jgi:carboxyl-terminal processing protease